jgi:hypothetical protein
VAGQRNRGQGGLLRSVRAHEKDSLACGLAQLAEVGHLEEQLGWPQDIEGGELVRAPDPARHRISRRYRGAEVMMGNAA